MKKSVSTLLGLVSALAMVVPLEAAAVDYGPRIANIWGTGGGGIGRGIGRIDIDDLTGGQELFIPGVKVTTIDPDGPGGNGDVRTEVTFATSVRDKSGAWKSWLQPMKVRSRPYPDPCYVENQEGGTNETVYDNNWKDVDAEPESTCEFNRDEVASFYADQGMINAAIGTASEERTLMFGLSVVGTYFTPSSDDIISVYRFFAYDADDSSPLCQLWLPGIDDKGWELERAFSGVGPYLGGGNSGDDVLRVAFVKDGAVNEGQLNWKYAYYDIRTCGLIDTVWATSPAP